MNAKGRNDQLDLGNWARMGRRDVLRLGAVSGLAIGAPSLAGCEGEGAPLSNGSSAQPPAVPTGVLRAALDGDPVSFDPSLADGRDLRIAANIYEGLTRFKGDGSEVEGELAESFESSKDAREWVFRLKSGITFHDGEPLTSSAVKASFEYWHRDGTTWPFVAPLDATYDDSDPLTIRITTKEPFPEMLRSATMIRIISPKVIAAGPDAVNKSPAGTGPFTFASYATSENIILEANDSYRGPGPYLERLEFQIIPDLSSRVAALRSGDVDLVTEISPTDVTPLRSDGRFVVTEKQVWRANQLIFFMYQQPADNLKVRQAIAHAIDRDAILRALFGGEGTTSDSVLPAGVYGSQEPATTYPHDLERAKQLISESGLSTPINMEIIWNVLLADQIERVERLISDMVKEIGINLTLKQLEIGEIAKIFDTSFEMPYHAVCGALGWITGGPLFFAMKYFQTVTRFDDFNGINDRMLVTPDGPERLQLLAEIQETFAQQLPVIPLYNIVEIDAHKASVHGYSIPNNGFMHRFGEVFVSDV